jgi:hypothetical protein
MAPSPPSPDSADPADRAAVADGVRLADALVDDLFNRFADSCDEYGLWSMGKDGLRAALAGWARPAAPVPVPVAVAERLPGEGDCDAEGRCWIFMPDIGTAPSWRLAGPRDIGLYHTHWLPVHAIPLPQAGEVEGEI